MQGKAGEHLPRVWASMDTRFSRGQLALVAAGPGVGKSAFMLNYALKSGVSCLYFSADSDASVQVSRSLAILGGLTMQDAVSLSKSGDTKRILELTGSTPVRFNYSSSPTLEEIEGDVLAYEELYGCYPQLIVIDNAMDVELGIDADQSQSLDSLMAWLHDLARKTQACVVALHHVTGPYNNSDTPIPLSGIKGQIGRVPELILTLHKGLGEYGQPDELRVSTVKNRGQKADPSGETYTPLAFDGYRMSIKDIDNYGRFDPWAKNDARTV